MVRSSAIRLTIGFGLALSGCSGGGAADQPKLAAAAGVVRFDSKPVANASVTFYPEKGPAAVGQTDAEGKFQVKTNGQLGAVVGKHKVTVVDQTHAGSAPPPSDGNAINFAVKATYSKKYLDPLLTDLLIDIPANGHRELVLDLMP